MTQKEKLIELLDIAFLDSDDNYGVPNRKQVADHLIANGVVVPVRCKDCKRRGTDDCPMHIKGVPADEDFLKKVDNDFCSYGERKDEANE